jgi:hypothetical protein
MFRAAEGKNSSLWTGEIAEFDDRAKRGAMVKLRGKAS